MAGIKMVLARTGYEGEQEAGREAAWCQVAGVCWLVQATLTARGGWDEMDLSPGGFLEQASRAPAQELQADRGRIRKSWKVGTRRRACKAAKLWWSAVRSPEQPAWVCGSLPRATHSVASVRGTVDGVTFDLAALREAWAASGLICPVSRLPRSISSAISHHSLNFAVFETDMAKPVHRVSRPAGYMQDVVASNDPFQGRAYCLRTEP